MPRRVSKIRVFPLAHGLEASKGAMPSGGPLVASAPEPCKVVDHAVSRVDRNRVHLQRKTAEPCKIFVPLDPNEITAGKGSRGKTLHTDPFAMDRDREVFKKSKVKIATPRREVAVRRELRTVVPPKHEENKKELITVNGLRHTSPKRVTAKTHATTHNLEQKAKTFNGSRRFACSPEKARPASAVSTTTAITEQSVVAPLLLLQGAPGDAASQMSTARITSGNTTYRSISNAFFDQGQVLNTKLIAESHRPTVRVYAGQPSMEGVFSPMRNGRVPKLQPVVAPWARDEIHQSQGRRTHAIAAAAPYAIQA